MRILFGSKKNDYLVLRYGTAFAIACFFFPLGGVGGIQSIALMSDIDTFFNGENICEYDQCPIKYVFALAFAYMTWIIIMVLPAMFLSGIIIKKPI